MADKKSSKKYLLFSLIVILAASLVSFSLYFLDFYSILEHTLLDLRFLQFNPQEKPSQDIVYVDIDDKSLQTLSPVFGGWPWARGQVIADHLINFISQGRPSILLFDILYTEYSAKSINVDVPEEDLILADYSALIPDVSHAVMFYKPQKETVRPMFEAAVYNFEVQVKEEKSRIDFPEYTDYLAPYPELAQSASLLHSVNYQEDSDGKIRHLTLLNKYKDKYYPSLTLRALKKFLKIDEIILQKHSLLLSRAGKKITSIPLNEKGDFLLSYYPDYNQFKSVTADAVIESSLRLNNGRSDLLVSPDEFKDKIVIIGASAAGLKDLKVTPMGKAVPGPYLHINAISNIQKGHYLHKVPSLLTIFLVIFCIVLITFSSVYFPLKMLRNLLGSLIVVILLAVSFLLFKYAALVVEISPVLVGCLVSYLASLLYVNILESSEKKKISNAMSKYIAPSVMKEVLDNYDDLIGGKIGLTREIAILFSDIRSFTSISESYEAEKVVDLLNTYMGRMIDIVFQYAGTMDKMIGDAIMAFWGAPQDQEDKDILAVSTALDMVRDLETVNQILEDKGFQAIKIGIGVNTGNAIVGNIGSSQRVDYTAIGDNINLGSRIEGLTKYYRTPVLVSGTTYQKSSNHFIFLPVDKVAVKGKKDGVSIYAPLDYKNPETEKKYAKILENFIKVRQIYIDGKFKKAADYFSQLAESYQDICGLCEMYAQRCDLLARERESKAWDGIWRMTTK